LPIESFARKRVFVRIDADIEQPANGSRVDEDKLRAALPTLEYLAAMAARVVVASISALPAHSGRRAARECGRGTVVSSDRQKSAQTGRGDRRNALAAVTEMRDGEIIVLENLRFYPGEDAKRCRVCSRSRRTMRCLLQ